MSCTRCVPGCVMVYEPLLAALSARPCGSSTTALGMTCVCAWMNKESGPEVAPLTSTCSWRLPSASVLSPLPISPWYVWPGCSVAGATAIWLAMPLGRLGVAPPVGTAVTPGAASATTGRPPRSTRTWKLPPVAGEKLVTPTLSVPPSLTITLRRDSVRLPRQSSLVSGAAPGGVTSKMGSNSVAVRVTTTCSPASTGTFRFTCPPGASCPSCSKSGRAAWPGCCAGAPVGDPPEPEQPTETAPSRAMRQSLSFTVAFLSQVPGEPAATKESYAVGVGVSPAIRRSVVGGRDRRPRGATAEAQLGT